MRGNRDGTSGIPPDEIATTASNPFAGAPMQPPTLRVVPTEMTMDMHMLGVMFAPSDRVSYVAPPPRISAVMRSFRTSLRRLGSSLSLIDGDEEDGLDSLSDDEEEMATEAAATQAQIEQAEAAAEAVEAVAEEAKAAKEMERQAEAARAGLVERPGVEREVAGRRRLHPLDPALQRSAQRPPSRTPSWGSSIRK